MVRVRVCRLIDERALANHPTLKVKVMSPKLKLLLSLILSIVYTVPAFAQAGKMRNGLPPTSMDSFVYEAGGNAELIYGDEGVTNIPPYFEFTYEHRINNGIF